MKKIIIFLNSLTILLFLSLLYISFEPTIIFKKCKPSTFKVLTYNEKDALIGSGSGFFISKNGLAITKYHVIRKKYKTRILLNNKLYDSSIIKTSEDRDLALLQVDIKNNKFLKIKKDHPRINENIYIFGYPRGFDSFSKGIICSTGPKAFITDAMMNLGSSGGAVVDSKGCIIGVCNSIDNQISVATNNIDLLEFLKSK